MNFMQMANDHNTKLESGNSTILKDDREKE
jgi:hypothetical protein